MRHVWRKLSIALVALVILAFSYGCASLDFFGGEKGEKAKFVVKETVGLAVDVASIKYPAEMKAAMVIIKKSLDMAEAAVKDEGIPLDELMKIVYANVPADSDTGLYARIILRRVSSLLNRFALNPETKLIDKEKALEIIAFMREAVGAY